MKLDRKAFSIHSVSVEEVREIAREVILALSNDDKLFDGISELHEDINEVKELFDPERIVEDVMARLTMPEDGRDGESIKGDKGDRGDKGDFVKGDRGDKGDGGKVPVAGVDFPFPEKGEKGDAVIGPKGKDGKDAISLTAEDIVEMLKRAGVFFGKGSGKSGGGGSSTLRDVTVTKDHTMNPKISVLLVDASDAEVAVTLPNVSVGKNKEYHIKKTDSSANSVIISTLGAEKIDGNSTVTIAFQHTSCRLYSDGSNWFRI